MLGYTDVVVGVRGIYDERALVGRELQFRSIGVLDNSLVTGDQMTAAILFGALTIGLDRLVSDKLIFCHGGRGLLTGTIPLLLPAGHTVIEVGQRVVIDDDVISGCERLREQGYSLALDDVAWGSGHDRLLPLASIIKIDVGMTSPEQLSALVERYRADDVRLLASGLHRIDDLPSLAALGFELFQGSALDRPKTVPGRTLAPLATSGIIAAADLLGAEPDFDRIEHILRRDPALTYQIMQLASIGRLGEPARHISSIRDAMVMSGVVQIRNWLALLLARPARHGDGAHDAFFATLLRARACELLAAHLDPPRPALGFAAGMLSALDVLLEVPLDELAAMLPLSDELRDAAFGGDTPLAHVVQDAATYNYRGAEHTQLSHLPSELFDVAFTRAFTWAMESAAVATQSPRRAVGQ